MPSPLNALTVTGTWSPRGARERCPHGGVEPGASVAPRGELCVPCREAGGTSFLLCRARPSAVFEREDGAARRGPRLLNSRCRRAPSPAPGASGCSVGPVLPEGPAGRAGGGPPPAGPGLTLWRRFAPQVFLQVRPPGSAHEEAPVREQTADPAAKTASRPPAGRGRGCVQRSCPFAPHPAASRTSPGKAFRGRKRHVRAAEQPWCVVFGWPWTRHGRLPCVVPTPLP